MTLSEFYDKVSSIPTSPIEIAFYSGGLGNGDMYTADQLRKMQQNQKSKPKGERMATLSSISGLAKRAGSAIANASPEIKQKALDYVRSATNGRVTTEAQVTSFANQGKNAFAIVASGAVKAGISPDHILDDTVLQDLRDRDLQNLATSLRIEFATMYGAIDSKSVAINAITDPTTRMVLAKEVCSFIKKAGLGGSVRETHAKLRIFTSLSDAEVANVGKLWPELA